MPENLSVVSLFSGAGGLDVGLERAGFGVRTAIDFDKDCVQSLAANQARELPVQGPGPERSHLEGTEIVEADVASLHASDLSRTVPDMLVGGPPCQPFSSSGAQRGVNDPRGRLFEEFVRLAEELRPRVILFENVRGLVTARGTDGLPGGAIASVKARFESIGYATTFALLNAADFGVPQRRVRLFMIGSRVGRSLPGFPSPTHERTTAVSMLENRKPWVTLGEFLAAGPRLEPDEIVPPAPHLEKQLRDLPSGSGLKSPGPVEPTRPSGHWGYKQGTFVADLQKPARTVTASATQDWVRDPVHGLRRLTQRECAGLQGFPIDWDFVGSRTSRFRQIGNAVPVTFGEVLGEALAEYLLANRHRKSSPSSEPFPDYMSAAIAYASRDDQRNGVSRVRSPHFAGVA